MNKLRVFEKEDDGLLVIQELKFGLFWWTVFKTYNENGASAFVSFNNKKYNKTTGYYE